MADSENAKKFKELGNAAFSAKDYPTAIQHFSSAIEADPNDHVFYSNRSACYASLEQYDKALDDAEICVNLKPDWVRGYTRKGLAEFYLKKYEEAKATYTKGLEIAPGDAAIMDMLQRVEQASAPQINPMASLFTPENMMKLQNHPKIREYMQDPSFMQMLGMMGNPQMMQMCMQDPRIQEVMGVLLGIDMSAMGGMGGPMGGPPGAGPPGAGPSAGFTPPPPQATPPPPRQPAASKPAEPAKSKFESPEQEQAEELKLAGNAHYKARRFAEAVEAYDKAWELYPKEIAYLTNKSAVLFEQGKYQECIDVCTTAIEKGREMHVDLVKIARALGRIGAAYQKLGDLDNAKEYTQKALMEAFDEKLKQQLKDIEKVKAEQEKLAYQNPELAEEANARANELFKVGSFPAAIQEYDEAIARGPTVAKYYCNRGSSYLKLMEPVSALTNIDKAIELDANYAKAYAVKGDIHYIMKEYHKAIDAFEKCKTFEPANERANLGMQKTMAAIQTANSNQGNDQERMAHAMADPEIQAILQDPQINNVLRNMQEDPASAQASLNDPKIRNSINKLIAAGVIKVG